MTRHDETPLWDYAARSLDAGETRWLEHHLEECPECQEKLEAVVLARQALLLAKQSKPLVAWADLDSKLEAAVDQRLRAKTARRWPVSVRVVIAVAALLALVGGAAFRTQLFGAFKPPPVEPTPLVAIRPVTADDRAHPDANVVQVDRARGLHFAGQRRPLLPGTQVRAGDVLETPADGFGVVHFADQSHARLAAATHVELQGTNSTNVALALTRGRISIHASHVPREDFVVRVGGFAVHVVGTVFSVAATGRGAEVAVLEGRVRVEGPTGDSYVVDAGQRLQLGGHGVTRDPLPAALRRELVDVQGLGDAPPSPPPLVPAVGGAPRQPPLAPMANEPSASLPRLDPQESRSRHVHVEPLAAPSVPAVASPPQPLAPAAVENKTELVVEAPARTPPTAANPAEPSAEWAALPPPASPNAPSAAPVVVNAKPVAKDLESIFLEKAETAMAKGTCENYLVGLEEVAADAQPDASERTERARILRARCFDTLLRPRQAMFEYRKYLEAFPKGQFAAEARQAVGQ